MSLMDKVKELLAPDEGETVLYDYECQNCDTTFTSSEEPDEVTCNACDSTDLEEVGRMYAGGGGGAPG
jgi:peptide subunit release factor 1 (eRF1)